ncbi:MAG: hypothetical protein ACC655_06480 [Rhodothermia bacterium]
MFRKGIHSLRPSRYTDQQIVVQVDNRLVIFDTAKNQSPVDLHIMPRGRRVLRRGWCEADAVTVLVGEYWPNYGRESVVVYSLDLVSISSERHAFEKGQIRHIHALEFDAFTQKVWIATGDADSECIIGQLDGSGRLENIVGQGAQRWRTVGFAFFSDAVYWGSDNHAGKNQIWRYDRSTSTVESMGSVTGPVYYNTDLPEHVIFSTAMENGEGDQDGYSRLYALDIAQGEVVEVRRELKDRWSPMWFGYGLFEFAEGSLGDNRFWVTAKGLKGGLRSELLELVV